MFILSRDVKSNTAGSHDTAVPLLATATTDLSLQLQITVGCATRAHLMQLCSHEKTSHILVS